MKESILKNIHLAVILYALWTGYTAYEEHVANLENLKNELGSVTAKLEDSKRKLKMIEKFRTQVGTFKERVAEMAAQIEKIQKQLPQDVNDTEVQALVGGMSQDLKMYDPSPMPGPEELHGFYFSKIYNYTGTGTFLQFLILLEQIEKQERILNIKKIAYKKSLRDERGRFQLLDGTIVFESYRYNMSHKESSGVEEIEQKYKVN